MNKALLKKSEAKYMTKIPQAEIIDMLSNLSDGAKSLLLYYYSRKDGWVFIEDNIAKVLKTSERQVAKYRRELIKKEFLYIQKGEIDVYLIGKEAVRKYKHSPELTA